jgi:hypothetical protein
MGPGAKRKSEGPIATRKMNLPFAGTSENVRLRVRSGSANGLGGKLLLPSPMLQRAGCAKGPLLCGSLAVLVLLGL